MYVRCGVADGEAYVRDVFDGGRAMIRTLQDGGTPGIDMSMWWDLRLVEGDPFFISKSCGGKCSGHVASMIPRCVERA